MLAVKVANMLRSEGKKYEERERLVRELEIGKGEAEEVSHLRETATGLP